MDSSRGMSGPFIARHVNLSSGQILFADPSKPWAPDNFPDMPSTLLAFTAISSISDGNISTLSFTNGRLYETFEPEYIRPVLQKSFQINNVGVVRYEESKVGFVSSFLDAFSTAITSFAPSTIGGANIKSVLQTQPDTITNALGKLDAWIANAFLLQPPPVTIVEVEKTSLYGGIRWLNFPTYSVLDKFVPYVTSMVFIVGDTDSPNYCTFELFDSDYFPYKTYTNGISPYFSPLVRFRVFTDFFLTNADHIYTKTSMQTKCIRLISESGDATFPATGKVLAFENTNGETTYTTLSIYLPNLKNTYPKDSDIPIKVFYLNRTDSSPNILCTSTIINTEGGPSVPSSITQVGYSDTSMDVRIVRPVYSDALAGVTEPFFSSYTVEYTLNGMNSVVSNVSPLGFRYGIPDPLTIPGFATPYSNVTFSQDLSYCYSTQTLRVTGNDVTPLYPGMLWSTTVTAINSANIVGEEGFGTPGIFSTGFPTTTTPSIDAMPLSNTSYEQTRYATQSTVNTPRYYGNGWATGDLISTDIVFLSTTMGLTFQLSTVCQFNDATYPGDRSTITANTYFTDTTPVTTNSVTLILSTFADDFPLDTSLSNIQGDNILRAYITDSESTVPNQKYFYNAQISGTQSINTISMLSESIQVTLKNHTLAVESEPEVQAQSTIEYIFQTEPVSNTSTTAIVFQNVVTGAEQVSGIYTPTTSSLFYFDVLGSNIGNHVVSSCFASAYLTMNSLRIGPQENYTSNLHIYNGLSEITTLPFPMDTTLTLSSCTLRLYSNVYQIHADPKPVYIAAKIQPAAPQTRPNIFTSTLTASIFIDTVSMNTISTFDKTTGPNGLRVLSLLPRDDLYGTSNNMNDGVDEMGNIGQGLNVTLNSYFDVDFANVFTVSPDVHYNHTSTMSTIYTDFYSRELLYTRGTYIHPAGYDFSQFNPALIGKPGAIYPDYTYDLVYDENFGFRYASFAYESAEYPVPTAVQYVYVTIKNPSALGTVQDDRTSNTFFPNDLVPPYYISSMKARMHVKVFGVYNAGTDFQSESSWVNGFTAIDEITFDDSVYNMPACHGASTIGAGADIEYKVQINRRLYTKLCPIVRIGISQDGSEYSDDPITFDAVQVRFSDE